jgi:uncharacterized protein CbrC (UPF0167 family)
MPEPLPFFRYHPDPVETGSIVESEARCQCCGKARGYVYTAAPHSEQDVPEDSLCPWCIADGSAHKEFGAEFVDVEGISADLPEGVVRELLERTPGYSSWQAEEWRDCCGDAAAFLGPYGYKEILEAQRKGENLKEPLLEHIKVRLGYADAQAALLLKSLDRFTGPAAYLFECLKCKKHLFHVDVA